MEIAVRTALTRTPQPAMEMCYFIHGANLPIALSLRCYKGPLLMRVTERDKARYFFKKVTLHVGKI